MKMNIFVSQHILIFKIATLSIKVMVLGCFTYRIFQNALRRASLRHATLVYYKVR